MRSNSSMLVPVLLLLGVVSALVYPNPLVFFAKIESSFLSLSLLHYNTNGLNMSILVHGRLAAEPVYFTLEGEDIVTATTLTPHPAAIHAGVLGSGANLTSTDCKFDFGMRVMRGPFKSCEIIGTEMYGLFQDTSPVPKQYCIDAELYLLPFISQCSFQFKDLHQVKKTTKSEAVRFSG